MLPQWRTVEILQARLEELGGSVDFDCELTGFEQDADGVTARLRGPDGTESAVRAGYLVAADGGRSTVRKALGVGFPVTELVTDPTLIADVLMDGFDRAHWHVWPTAPGGRVAIRALEGPGALSRTARRVCGARDGGPGGPGLVRDLLTFDTPTRQGPSGSGGRGCPAATGVPCGTSLPVHGGELER